MTSISLVDDHDLDETNNYANRDYHRFYPALGPTHSGWPSYPDPLPPHQSDTTRPGLYSKHGLGLALLIALPFYLGGRTLTLIVLAAIAALLAANMTLLAARYTRLPGLAALSALALALTNPLFSFSLLIFPEMSAALAITYATRRLLADRNHPWQWLLTGAAIAVLPWLHYRLTPISVILAVIAVIRFRRQWTPPSIISAAILPASSASALLWWHRHLYNSPFPPSTDHAGFSGFTGTINGLAGTFLDQQWGAFIHNPLLLLAVSAFVPFALARRRDASVIAVLVLPYLILISAYRVWWGEWNPPARYLTDVVPLAVIPLAWLFDQLPGIWRWLVPTLFALPAAAVIATFVNDPQLMYNQPDGTSRLLETWHDWIGIDATRVIPSFVFYSESSLTERLTFGMLGLAWVGTIASVIYVLTRLYPSDVSTEPPFESN
jgi:hypothetical protein